MRVRATSSRARCCSRSASPHGSIPRPEVRGGEALAHHPPRPIGYVRVRARRRPGRMGGVGRLMFADADPDALAGKLRAAFRGGFLGVASFGWSTLVQIVDATEGDRDALIDTLAKQLR